MSKLQIQPNPSVRHAKPYSVPKEPRPIDLWLNANEGAVPPDELRLVLESAATLRRYPSTDGLRTLLAARVGVEPDMVAVTAGGDDAIDRACRAVLGPGKEIILTPPTFEMFDRYAKLTGAKAVHVPWVETPFPTEHVLARITEQTAAIAVVSPNNPTGLVATADDLRRIARAAPHALIIADLAYTEFADVNLQPTALEFPNVVSIRTLSKAWGLAGLRVGYAVGDPRVINWIRSAGGPYVVSGPSAAIAAVMLERFEHVMRAYVERVKIERRELYDLLESVGLDPWSSQANFVTTGRRFDVHWDLCGPLADRGISVRVWSNRTDLPGYAMRITCPGSEHGFDRLKRGILQAAKTH